MLELSEFLLYLPWGPHYSRILREKTRIKNTVHAGGEMLPARIVSSVTVGNQGGGPRMWVGAHNVSTLPVPPTNPH